MSLPASSNRAERPWPELALLAWLWPALLLAQPANDPFTAASLLTGWSGSVTGTTWAATSEPGEPSHGGEPAGASVWYRWQAPASGTAEFDLHGSDFDTTLGAYTGTAVYTLTAVAQNDDEFDYVPLVSKWLFRSPQSRLRFPAQAGASYFLAVDGSGGGTGSLRLNWELKAPPTNDAFSAARILAGADGFLSTHNVGATRQQGEPNHATNAGSASIWFRWTAPASGSTRFHTLNSLTALAGPLDTLLAVYTGGSLGTLSPVVANDNNGSSLRSLVQFTASAGSTYHIAVDTKAAATNHGHLLLTWANGAPANDTFASAQVITGRCGLAQGHNTFATKQRGEPDITGNTGGASIWYSWTAPADGLAMFTTQGSPFLDTMLAVYTGNAVNALSLVEENDDVTGGFMDGLSYSRVEFLAAAGTTYRIVIDGYKSGSTAPSGVTFLHWALEPAANDAFHDAQPLSGASGTVTGGNAFATKEPGEPTHAGNDGGRSVWYRWLAPTSGVAVVDLAGSHFDTLLAVYRAEGAPAVEALTLVAQNDDPETGFDLAFHSRVAFPATAGETYYVAVDGLNDGAGYISDGWLVLRYNLYPTPVLRSTRAGRDIILQWSGPYVLETIPTLEQGPFGAWTPLPGLSPVTLPAGPGNGFLRLRGPVAAP
jgi:hypothetical protein